MKYLSGMELITNRDLELGAAEDLKILAEKIKQKREELGMSAYELAHMAGVSARTVRNAERGENANYITLSKIMRILKGRMVAINIW